MKLILSFLISLIISTSASCNSQKTMSHKLHKNELKSSTDSSTNKSKYTYGTIIINKENSECSVLIELEDGVFFDPINLDEKFESFKIDKLKIKFTYQPLRMMNRCDKANPISIVELLKSEN